MLITMFTDASWRPDLRRATWAVWSKTNGVTERYSGIIRSEIENTGEAELAALANGLHVVHSRFSPPAGSKIICQIDSEEALAAIRGNHPRPHARLIASSIRHFFSHHNLNYSFRHVKAHKGNATPRNAVNSWCDKECKRQMTILLAQLAHEREGVVQSTAVGAMS